MGRVALKAPAGENVLERWRDQPGMLGVTLARQPVMTRLTAFGPLPFLSGSTSKEMRCPSVKDASLCPRPNGRENQAEPCDATTMTARNA